MAKKPQRPNVVLIVVDSLRRDHLGCYGYSLDTSPALDSLARDCVRYDAAFSQAPWTTPSIGSLLACAYPSELGIEGDRSIIGDRFLMLAEVLEAAGYTTGAVVSHSFCSKQWNFDQGFDEFDDSNIHGLKGVSSPGVTEAAFDFLNEHCDEPFFLWLHYFDPHFDYVNHDGFEFPEPAGMRSEEAVARKVPQRMARYDSEIAFTDHHIGRLIERLRKMKLYDDTMIVFTADHGEEFLDHGELGHTRTLFNELVEVPLLIKYPHGRPGVVSDPVALVDVYPTVLEALGVPVPDGVVGRSLLDSAAAPEDGRRFIFSETSRRSNLRGCVSGSLKVVQDLDTGRVSRFDLAADPLERRDLAAEEDERFPPVIAALREWIAGLPQNRAEQTELSPEQVRRLKALGYTGE